VVSPGSTAITANYSYDIQIASDSGFSSILATFTAYSSNTLNYKTGSTIFARAKTNFAGLQSGFGSTATG
jgi:ABC-type molybdate transport system ATPase subunit